MNIQEGLNMCQQRLHFREAQDAFADDTNIDTAPITLGREAGGATANVSSSQRPV